MISCLQDKRADARSITGDDVSLRNPPRTRPPLPQAYRPLLPQAKRPVAQTSSPAASIRED